MSIYQTLWNYIPTPNQPVAFVLAVVIAGMLLTVGVKLIWAAAKGDKR
jgi:hypothetical protein